MSAFPTTPIPSSASVRSIAPTRISVAQSLKRQVRSTGAQRWGIKLSWAAMSRASMAPIWAFMAAMRGQFGTCTIVLPTPYNVPQGSWNGTPKVNGAGQTGRTIIVDGFSLVSSKVAKAGDLIKFADSKVYMVTADADSDSSGEASIAIEPALIVSPADNESVVYTSVPFTVAATSDLMEHPMLQGALFTFDLDLLEAY